MPYTDTPYIVETADGDKTTGRFLDEAGLVKFLTGSIEAAHYSGDDIPEIKIIRYTPVEPGNGPGFLSELIMAQRACTRDDNDYLHYRYTLHEHADAEAFGVCDDNQVLEFTVRIDGRA